MFRVEDKTVQTRRETITCTVKPWEPESPLPNLVRDGFRNIAPYTYFDSFDHRPRDRDYEALIVENAYLRVTVVPDLGARVFSLYDKLAGAEVFNMPAGVFPSPIYLRGPYLPIGLEFNFPSGHNVHAAARVPAEFVTEGDAQGIRLRVYNACTRIHTGITVLLRPAERLMRTRVTLTNTLPVRNGYMYWANPAVRQTPGTAFQCKAPMSFCFTSYNTFPFIDGVDYRIAGNRPFASDAFAIDSPEDWFGFYSPEVQRGAVHLSPRDQLPGKKFFSWGFDEYAFRWARHFGCDEHGYVEFQAGLPETQLEYTHLEPFATNTVDECWFPYHETGNVSHATESLILSHEPDALHVTSARAFESLRVAVTAGRETRGTVLAGIKPGMNASLSVPPDFDPDRYDIRITDSAGATLLDQAVRTPAVATPGQVAGKQAWLDLKPVDHDSILELAHRRYKAREFLAAENYARQLTSTTHAAEAERLLAEIAWIKDQPESVRVHADAAGECAVRNMAEGSRPLIDAGVEGERLQMLDAYAVLAQADGLYSDDRPEEALRTLCAWEQATGNSSRLLACVRGFLAENIASPASAPQRAEGQTVVDLNPHTVLERKALEQALELEPADAAAARLLGNYWAARDEELALRCWRQAVDHDPDDYVAWRNQGYVLARRRDLEAAAFCYARAQQACASCPALIVEHVRLLRLCGELTGALQLLDGLAPDTAEDYRVIKIRAEILRDNHRFQDALDCMLSCDHIYVWEGECNLHRCYVECLLELGRRALARGDLDAARGCFERLLESPEPLVRGKPKVENVAAAHYHLALVAEQAGDRQAADRQFRLAVDQPYTEWHHWVSYRENEYYGALAARRLGDEAAFRKITDRLVTVYAGEAYDAAVTDFMPTGCAYAPHLAAARGFILSGQLERARTSLQNGIRAHGHCWPLEQVRGEIKDAEKGAERKE